MGHVDGFEASNILLVLAQELTAGGKSIVDHVKDFAVDSSHEASQGDRLSAVFDVRKGYCIGAT